MNALSLTYMVLTRALIASLYRIIGLASILPLPNGIFGCPMRDCPPEWKWLFATLQRYNVKHKHNQGKRVANGIACSKEGGNATSPLHSRGSPNKGGQNQKSKLPLGVTMMPLGAPSISKYRSLVRPDAQIVALRVHCACTALQAPPKRAQLCYPCAERRLPSLVQPSTQGPAQRCRGRRRAPHPCTPYHPSTRDLDSKPLPLGAP